MIAPAKNTTVAIYTRLSVERPDQELSSVAVQRERCEAYAASQGWTVLPDHFDDDGFTGGNTQRPALRRLLQGVRDGSFDTILVVRLDRLTRRLRDFVEMMDLFEEHDVAFASVTEPFDTTTSGGLAFVSVMMTFAELERRTIGERTSDKIRAARERGQWTGGRPILGYDVHPDGGRLVVNEREQLVVQGLFGLFLEHGSLRLTAEAANDRGWTLKRWTNRRGSESGGGPFTKTALHGLLTNPLYLGKVRSNGDLHDGEHEAIVDPGVFDDVQRRLRSNGHKRSSASRSRDSQSWLRGLIRCAACDAPMTPSFTTKRHRRYRYYVCVNAQRQGWHSCPIKSVAAGDVEAAVLAEVAASIQGDTALRHETIREVHAQRKARITELKREIRITEMERDSANGNASDVNRRLTRLTTELAALSADKIADADVAQAVEEFEPLWDALNYREQAEVAGLLIESVRYDGDAVEIKFREPEVDRGDG